MSNCPLILINYFHPPHRFLDYLKVMSSGPYNDPVQGRPQKDRLMLDSFQELYKWFTQQIMRNFHMVFTMNPLSEGLKDRATTSYEFTNKVDLDVYVHVNS